MSASCPSQRSVAQVVADHVVHVGAIVLRIEAEGLDEVRDLVLEPLLVEVAAVDAVRVARERQRPVAHVRQEVGRDPRQVEEEVALGESAPVLKRRPELLVEVGERDLLAFDRQDHLLLRLLELIEDVLDLVRAGGDCSGRGVRRRGQRLFAAHVAGALSSRRPRKLGARRMPSFVHWANFTCATSSGLTQTIFAFLGRPNIMPLRAGSWAKGRSSVRSASSRSFRKRRVLSSKPVPTWPAKTSLPASS